MTMPASGGNFHSPGRGNHGRCHGSGAGPLGASPFRAYRISRQSAARAKASGNHSRVTGMMTVDPAERLTPCWAMSRSSVAIRTSCHAALEYSAVVGDQRLLRVGNNAPRVRRATRSMV